jgi:hypothetical protein
MKRTILVLLTLFLVALATQTVSVALAADESTVAQWVQPVRWYYPGGYYYRGYYPYRPYYNGYYPYRAYSYPGYSYYPGYSPDPYSSYYYNPGYFATRPGFSFGVWR